MADGELGRVDKDGLARQREYSGGDKKTFYQNLLWIARERGYKPGWAFHKYLEKFGTQPGGAWKHADPIAPDQSVRSWVRSRQIAWAKAQEKRAGAA